MSSNLQFFIIFSSSLFLSCQDQPVQLEWTMNDDDKSPVEWITFQGDRSVYKSKKIVLVSGDEEYRSEEALPQLAKILASRHGFDCRVLFAQDPNHPGIVDPNYVGNIPGVASLEEADLMILFTRFRDLPNEQMQYFENFLKNGKPLIAIRTATHAFRFKDSTSQYLHWGNYYKNEDSDWEGGFGRKILGANWYYHHGHHKHQSTRGIFAPGASENPILKGISDGKIWGSTDVYGMPLPLPGDANPIVLGQVVNRAGEFDKEDIFFGMKPSDDEIATADPENPDSRDPNNPMMPIVWTKSYQIADGIEGYSITSTIGASSDILNEELRRLFVNSVYYLLDLDVPESADVAIIGDYKPTAYNFQSDEYWDEKAMKVSGFLEKGEE